MTDDIAERFKPRLYAVFTARRLGPSSPEPRQQVRAAFVNASDAASFMAAQPWPDLWHLETADGKQVASIWSRDGNRYSHASALMAGAKTHYGPEDSHDARAEAEKYGWQVMDLRRPLRGVEDD